MTFTRLAAKALINARCLVHEIERTAIARVIRQRDCASRKCLRSEKDRARTNPTRVAGARARA